MKSIYHALCALLFFTFSATSALAVTLVYTYQGNPISCYPSDPLCCLAGPGWTGSITINESLYPTGSVKGSTLTLMHNADDPSNPINGYTITKGPATYTGSWTGGGFGPSGLLTGYTGHVGQFISGAVAYDNYINFTFDSARNIIAWDGTSFQGGSNDPFTSSITGDGYSGTPLSPPGTWTLAAIPLPAGLPLILLGTAALVGLRRRKS